jgi:STAS domain
MVGLLLASLHGAGRAPLTYKIHRSVTPDAVVFAVSGEMDAEPTAQLQEFVARQALGRIVLDLREVTLVGQTAVRFLARAEEEGICIVNCPSYVRTWILAERAGQSSGRAADQAGEQ